MRLWWQEYYEWQYSSEPIAETESDGCEFHFSVYGEVDPEMDRRMHRMQMEALAPLTPQIPQWLAENPPSNCSFLPNGEVLVEGELGTGVKSKPRPGGVSVVPDTVFSRYSPTGKLLGRVEPGQYWWELYFDNWLSVVELYDIPNTHYAFSNEGVVEIFDESMNRTAVYSFEGGVLPHEYDSDSDQAWVNLYGRDLGVLYDIQQQGAAQSG
jgi:hypothetical protein